MKKVFFFTAIALFSIACNSSSSEKGKVEETKKETVKKTKTEAAVYPYKAGTEFDVTLALNNNEFITKWENFEGDTMQAVLKADITEACQKKGCWMNVNLGEDHQMMVKFKGYEFFVPLDAAGHVTTVSGIAFNKEVSVQHLKHLAEDAGADQDSINNITKPKQMLTFVAEGVVVE